MKIEYKLMIRETGENRLSIREYSEDRKYLEDKAEKLLAENPDWQVFVVKENYNVS